MFIDFFEREKVGRERETLICYPPIWGLTGDTAHSLGMCPDQELNLKPLLCAG